MKGWKESSSVRNVHEELYETSNSNETADSAGGETYLSLIVKKVFVSNEEQTKKNAIWCQAVLEIIFDKNILSPKIDADAIDKWYSKLIEVLFFLLFVLSFYYFYQFY
jgi:hypothetical protein